MRRMISDSKLQAMFAHMSDSQLLAAIDAPIPAADRIKSGPYKGAVKMAVAKHIDRMLLERDRRRHARIIAASR